MNPFNIISWVIVVAFVAILIVTVLGMIGIVKFQYKDHLNKLFTLLVVEIVGMGFLIYAEGKEDHSRYLRQAQDYYTQSIALKEEGKYDESLQLLSDILRLDDGGSSFHVKDVFLQRGNILFSRNLFSDAITPYAVYNEIVQDDAQSLARYGRALRAVHRYEDAKVVYERALALAPNDYYILNGLQNCLRRQAGFLLDASRRDASEKYFRDARQHIISMQTIAKTASEKKEKKLLNAELALARLNWQWERYPEAISLFEEIIQNHPDHSTAIEDLAAIYLEYGQTEGGKAYIVKSLEAYKNAYRTQKEDQDKIYIGSGIAEATAFLDKPTKQEIDYALKTVSLSIAKNQTQLDDPYPFYASALLHKKLDNTPRALHYLDEAIRAEQKRSDNVFTFDYKRLVQYERLKAKWLMGGENAQQSE